jgi:hypothetical protein
LTESTNSEKVGKKRNNYTLKKANSEEKKTTKPLKRLSGVNTLGHFLFKGAVISF